MSDSTKPVRKPQTVEEIMAAVDTSTIPLVEHPRLPIRSTETRAVKPTERSDPPLARNDPASEPETIQQQRRILRSLHATTADYARAKAEAEAAFKQERDSAEGRLQQARQQADERLGQIQQVARGVRKLLEADSGGRKLLDSVSATPAPEQQGADPKAEIEACHTRVTSVHNDFRQKFAAWTSGDFSMGIAIFLACFSAWSVTLVALASVLETGLSGSGLTFSHFGLVGLFGGGSLALTLLGVSWIESRKRTVRDLYTSIVQASADAEYWHQQWLKQAQARYEKQCQQAEARRQRALEELEATYLPRIDQLGPELLTRIGHRTDALVEPWDHARWDEWKPATTVPAITRLGEMSVATPGRVFSSLALLPFPGQRSLLFEAVGSVKPRTVQAIQALLLRLLAAMPPGKLRFTFIDPVGLGQNVAPFMHLHDHDETLVTSKAWTEPQHIEQRLADLTEHMENVIQKYLRNQFATIADYNAQAGEIAEPYRVLVVLDFPVNFRDNAARRLVSIAQNGPRCGVYTVVLADTSKPAPHGFNLDDLKQNATVIAWHGERFVWRDEDFQDSRLELDSPPNAKRFERILNVVGDEAKAANRVEVPFERVAPPVDQWWTGDSCSGLRVPLGPSGARKVQYLELGTGTAQHALVVGKTGSGKSTLLHTLIANLALTYSPNEVALYLVDFKKGVEFKTYAERQLPHARVIAIESEREFGLSVLQGLDDELKRRGDRFRAAGVDGLADYREKSGQGLPRILLLVDEFQEFFTEDDTIASQAGQILDRLVRQGRAFGIHVLLGSQTLAGAYSLARSTIDQMAVRIALQCSEADSRLILADDNPAARLLSRPGEALYNAANGLVEGNNRFQVAWLPDDQRDRYLERIAALARDKERGAGAVESPVVFEGNAPAVLEPRQRHPLHDLLMAPVITPARVTRTWLGEPLAIRDAVTAGFRRQSGSNLLLVGQHDEAALGLLTIALVSLAAQLSHGNNGAGAGSPFSLLDFGMVDAPSARVLPDLAEQLPVGVRLGRRRELPSIIGDLAEEVQRRLDADETTVPLRYLLLYGLHRARDLRQEESYGFSAFGSEPAPPSPAQQFTTILREGPEVGIHTIVWCDTLTNLNRSLDRRALREFALRVAFQMSAEDSTTLIDTPVASKLGPYRAIFANEDEGRLEKFRPYALPSEEWRAWATGALAARERAVL